ncbi:DUF5813 family protein [Halovenus salina]|uniref:DUF5813 family protein n=1 Tax=Halovenus salina TaxID=1510225 RepID=A0ABD5W2S5_9EURY|nr:DUF5813 family protein [Halovenus salina]
MTDTENSPAVRALSSHDAFERAGDEFRLLTVVFDTAVAVEHHASDKQYTVRVKAPTIQGATEDHVGDTVETDWLETFERRLADAPSATRTAVEIDDMTVEDRGKTVSVRYQFSCAEPDLGATLSKTFAEFVEGTYAEGIIPGYDYTPPVSELLSDASQGETGGTPL